MPPGFTKAFAERLDKNSFVRVVEARHEEQIRPGIVYIAPGGYHMTIRPKKIVLDTSPPIHGVKPAVDKLFISAAEVYKNRILCCVFTGMEETELKVSKPLNQSGFTMAQDETTSVIYGMPRAAYETGCVDAVLPDYEISQEIVRLVEQK